MGEMKETVETVEATLATAHTPLKQGVNETAWTFLSWPWDNRQSRIIVLSLSLNGVIGGSDDQMGDGTDAVEDLGDGRRVSQGLRVTDDLTLGASGKRRAAE